MEVDEVETDQLLQRFGCMQTVDRADLIEQMRRLVGGNDAVSEPKAAFYLEMSNWNVQTAVGYYFDLEARDAAISDATSDAALPQMTFVEDVTVGEGQSAAPGSDFVKTWTVRNPGPGAWPAGVVLRLASGHRMGVVADAVPAVACGLPAGAAADVSVSMRAPAEPGIYESQWRLALPTGAFFGDPIWCILTVEPAGTLDLSQALANMRTTATTTATPRRPSSPTDADCAVVTTRNVLLTRTTTPSAPNNSGGGDDDDEMI